MNSDLYVFHLAENEEDYKTILELWPDRLGAIDQCVQLTIANGIRNAAAIIARDKQANCVAGAVILVS